MPVWASVFISNHCIKNANAAIYMLSYFAKKSPVKAGFTLLSFFSCFTLNLLGKVLTVLSIKGLLKGFYDRLLSTCLLCRGISAFSERICSGCMNDLPKNNNACYCCAEPMQNNDFLCGQCQQKERPFFRSVVPYLYEFPVAEMLKALKYKQNLTYALPLSVFLSRHIQTAYEEDVLPDVIIPMPLHRTRLVSRGYNQAGVLAKKIAQQLSLPLDTNLVKRIKNTPPLLEINAKNRKIVLKSAFFVQKNTYNRVALVDDIVTSGASIESVTDALKKSGIERVDIWCVARTRKN